MKLHSFNVAGDLHQATHYCNLMGWADYMLYIGPDTALSTIVVLRTPDKYDPTIAMKRLVKQRQAEVAGKITFAKVCEKG